MTTSTDPLVPLRPQPLPLPRVVHVSQQLKSGGAETLIRGLCGGLAQAGLDVSVISIYDDALTPSERAGLGFPSRSVGRGGRADVAFFPRLVQLLRDVKPDIVHGHLHAGKYAGRAAAIAAGVPAIVFTEHGDEAGGALRFALNRFLHARTKRFVTFSETQRREFASREGVPLERVVVIPNGIGEPPEGDRAALRASLRMDPDTFALFLPARLCEQKNQTLALRAFACVAQRYPAWHLFLAGKGAHEAELRALARDLGIEERTTFLGFRDDAPLLCRAMDAFLMPSIWERMPLALGEAMRASLAIVTTPWDGCADVVSDGETGIVAADMSVAGFAHALERLCDGERRATMVRQARSFAAARFDLGTSVRRHLDLYASLAAANR